MQQTQGRGATGGSWDTSYEWRAVTLLGIGFGLVGLDRWIIASLLPLGMAADLGLDVQDGSNAVGALGLAWGVLAIFSGRFSDKVGHRKVLIPAIVLFSLLSGLSGVVTGVTGLIAIRALMGAMEGSYCPTSFTAVAAASLPKRRGFNQGLQQSGFALLGLGLGPIIATQLLHVVPSWRWVFWIVAIPGFIVGALLFAVLREPAQTQGGALIGATQASGRWLEVLKRRNVVLGMLALFCAMSCVFVLSALVPTYLVSYLKLSADQMAIVTSALGFGGFFGQFGVPGLSDVFGRRAVAVVGFVGAAASLWLFAHTEQCVFVPACLTRRIVCHVANKMHEDARDSQEEQRNLQGMLAPYCSKRRKTRSINTAYTIRSRLLRRHEVAQLLCENQRAGGDAGTVPRIPSMPMNTTRIFTGS